ncbi:MAG TPA: hypothetical protein VF905_13010 [Nitrospirota bacterium]
MSERVIIDLREPLRNFSRALSHKVSRIPEYVVEEVVNLVFDFLIYELEDCRDEPQLSRLGNFYRDEIEPDPRFYKKVVESFFALMDFIGDILRGHGIYAADGFEYRPERNYKNRSIVVKKFESSY